MNRRGFLKTLAAGTFGVGETSHRIGTQAATMSPPVDPVWHALNRVTYGPHPGQADAIRTMGIAPYIEWQLKPDKIDDSDAEKLVSQFTTLNMTGAQLLAVSDNRLIPLKELDTATILRAVYSRRQLYEIMCNFWMEHFSIWHLKDQDKYLTTIDNHDVTRQYALGKFRDILGASARSPAMLIYLDNAYSDKKHPNENYAREVMELHTITVGNYTEADVQEVARCFTGWSIEGERNTNPGDFIFRDNMHDFGAKTVLGHTIPAGGGQQDGETVLDMLASHPGTALHISSKLCRRFIADDPPENVVKACQQAFLQSGGDIPTVLRVIFASPEFMNAPPKFKRPWEYLISLMRTLDSQIDPDKLYRVQTEVADPKGGPLLLDIFQGMGQLPFDHITPDGYTDYASLWETTMLERWNAAIKVVYGTIPGIHVDLLAFANSRKIPQMAMPIIQFFAQYLYGRSLTQSESDALLGFMNQNGIPDLTTDAGRKRVIDTVALMLAAPAFQWR